jgi:hypothetical protein
MSGGNMKFYSVLLLIILTSYSYASTEPQKWHVTDIVGYNLKLIDKKTYQSFTFSADHNLVAAEIGTVDGPIAVPLWYWKINKDGILIIKDDDGKIWYRMKKLYEKNGRIGVELSGKKVEYEKRSAENIKKINQSFLTSKARQ